MIALLLLVLTACGTGSGADAPADTASESAVSPDSAAGFSLYEEDGRLLVREEGTPVLAYNFEPQLADGVPERYRRAGYIHPVWSPDGTVLTDDFPEDHYHHRGISWMWPRVRVGDAQYDLWHLQGVRQEFREWTTRKAGPSSATVAASVAWVAEGTTIVDEQVRIRVHPASSGRRAIDVRLTLEATGRPVTLLGQSNQDKGYGGFSFRFAPRDTTVIVSPEGREEDSDHQRLAWADESGRFTGATGWKGAAIFQHPDHPGHPVQWTLRHYGFLGVAWPGNDGHTLEPGSPVTLRYRMLLHEGTAEDAGVAKAYQAFRNDPQLSAAP